MANLFVKLGRKFDIVENICRHHIYVIYTPDTYYFFFLPDRFWFRFKYVVILFPIDVMVSLSIKDIACFTEGLKVRFIQNMYKFMELMSKEEMNMT